LQTRYSIGHHIDSGVREALLLFQEEDWEPAIEADGTVRDGRGTNVGSSSVALAHDGVMQITKPSATTVRPSPILVRRLRRRRSQAVHMLPPAVSRPEAGNASSD
jgi:hypothetical protein